MDLGLKDRVAIVAASSQGLGKGVALALAREGAKLAICARSKGAIQKAADEIRGATGADVLARATDVSKHAEVRLLVAETMERFGRIDICVTNAGGPPSKTFGETTVGGLGGRGGSQSDEHGVLRARSASGDAETALGKVNHHYFGGGEAAD